MTDDSDSSNPHPFKEGMMESEDRPSAGEKQALFDRVAARVPKDPYGAFAYFVSRCAEGLGRELMQNGKTAPEARNTIIGCFLDFAAGEACRLAREEQREPDYSKWQTATDDAFGRAVKRTDPSNPPRSEASGS